MSCVSLSHVLPSHTPMAEIAIVPVAPNLSMFNSWLVVDATPWASRFLRHASFAHYWKGVYGRWLASWNIACRHTCLHTRRHADAAHMSIAWQAVPALAWVALVCGLAITITAVAATGQYRPLQKKMGQFAAHAETSAPTYGDNTSLTDHPPPMPATRLPRRVFTHARAFVQQVMAYIVMAARAWDSSVPMPSRITTCALLYAHVYAQCL